MFDAIIAGENITFLRGTKMAKKMINLSTEEVQKYCSLYKLSHQASAPYDAGVRYYYDEKEKLALKKDTNGTQAYSEEQINKLIFRQSSRNTIMAVIELHDKLILDLSPAFIYQIAAHYGGSQNLKAFITETQNLRNQGQTWETLDISIDDVVRILSHLGGSKNLKAFITATQNLRNQKQTWETLGLSIKDVVHILSRDGGSKNLKAFITATQSLINKKQTWETLGLSIDDVVRIISTHGGSKNLDAFITTTQHLRNQKQTWETLGLSIKDVVHILSNHGGSKNLDAFIIETQNLKNQKQTWETLGISIKDVVRILSNHGGSKNLEAFITTTQHLRNQKQTWETLGISIDDVVRILSHDGGHIKLKKVCQYSPLLFNLGFSIQYIIKAVKLPVENFSIMVKFVHELSMKFKPQQIIALSKKREFKKNIHDLLSDITLDHALNFTQEEITVLNDIFSLDNDQISPISSSNIHIADKNDTTAPFNSILSVNNSMFNNKRPRDLEDDSDKLRLRSSRFLT